MESHRVTAGRFAKEVDVRFVTAKIADVVVDPLNGHHLVSDSKIAASSYGMGREHQNENGLQSQPKWIGMDPHRIDIQREATYKMDHKTCGKVGVEQKPKYSQSVVDDDDDEVLSELSLRKCRGSYWSFDPATNQMDPHHDWI